MSDETKKVEDERKAELVKKAHRNVFEAVNQLIDVVEEEVLLENLNLLDVGTWNEIIEERYLSSLCGFPTCSGSTERQAFTGRKYKIDRREKKIYTAIPQYEKFCSSLCYKKSCHLQQQLYEEALWFNLDRPLKKYSLDVSSHNHRPKRVEDIFVEETDKLLLTRLNELKIADNAESSDKESEDEYEDENAETIKKKDENEKFLGEIRSFVTSVANMSAKSSSNMMGINPVKPQKPRVSKIVNEELNQKTGSNEAKPESIETNELKTEDKPILPVNAVQSTDLQVKTSSPKPQFTKQEMEQKLEKLRSKYGGLVKKSKPEATFVEPHRMNPEFAAKCPEDLR